MLAVLGLAAAIWGGEMLLHVPPRSRWIALALLYLAVIALHLILPLGHGLRMATGHSAEPWLWLGGIIAIVLAYARGLQWLKRRVPEATQTSHTPAPTFTDKELDRYARHIVLHEIGGAGQKKLRNARVLVIGAGGLGSPALLYLAAAGVGTIGVMDDDRVENSNLQRQVIHSDESIGMAKVVSAERAVLAQNPAITVRPYARRLTKEIAADLFAEYDVILDGTDNSETRYLVNQAAVDLGKPLISGALAQWEGQLSLFHPASGAPCYACIFPEAPAAGLAPSCAEAGVVGPLPGVIGAMMALETIKLITGAGQVLRGEMLIYDALYSESRRIKLKRREDCAVCGGLGKDGEMT